MEEDTMSLLSHCIAAAHTQPRNGADSLVCRRVH